MEKICEKVVLVFGVFLFFIFIFIFVVNRMIFGNSVINNSLLCWISVESFTRV